jgi:hypothetical protein
MLGLILSSVRGILVVTLDFNPNFVYISIVIIMILVSYFGYLSKKFYSTKDFILLRNILKFNLIFGIVNIFIDLFLGVTPYYGIIYLFIAPYIVFIFLQVSYRYLHVSVAIITCLISYSVLGNFLDSISGAEGLQKIHDYNLALRPDSFQSLGRTGQYFRPSGYTGSYHDSANILGMAVVYFFSRLILKRRIVDFLIFVFAMISLLLTQSAANIIITIGVLIIFSIYMFIKLKGILNFKLIVALSLCTYLLWYEYSEYLGVFIDRINYAGAWDGMMTLPDNNQQDSFIFTRLLATIFGHAVIFEIEDIFTEIGFYGTILQLGIFHAVIFFSVMLFPLWKFIKHKAVCFEAIPPLAAVMFGFISLLHYGSVTRVTSVFLFYAFFSMCVESLTRYEGSRKNQLQNFIDTKGKC